MKDFLTTLQSRFVKLLKSTEESAEKRLVIQDSGLGLSEAARRFVNECPDDRLHVALVGGLTIPAQLRWITKEILTRWAINHAGPRQGALPFPVRSALIVIDNIEFVGRSPNLTKFIVTLNEIPTSAVRLGVVLIGHDDYMCGQDDEAETSLDTGNRLSARSLNILGQAHRFRAKGLSGADIRAVARHYGGTTEVQRFIHRCVKRECLFPAFRQIRRATALLKRRPDLLNAGPKMFARYLAHQQALPRPPNRHHPAVVAENI